MASDRYASIVRFFRANNSVVGAGFLVTEKTILTCAHVVTAALGIPQETPIAPEAPLCLDFPLVAPNQKSSAHVDPQYWLPILPDGSGDIALICLDEAPPEGAKPARLVDAEKDLWEQKHEFDVFGFPENHSQGAWASGVLRGRRADSLIQIEYVKEPGYRVQPGFSGGAIWNNQLGGIVGMAVAADINPTNKVAYMIPTAVLLKACPQLEQTSIPPCPYRGLNAFLEKDEPFFFGRESYTRQLVEVISRKPFVAIVGISGSGKSSLVFAGLAPHLRRQGDWLIIPPFRPRGQPFHYLAAELIDVLETGLNETKRLDEIDELAQSIQQKEGRLQKVLERIAQKHQGKRILLIADQFEELYTLCHEPEIQRRFLDELLAAIQPVSEQSVSSCKLVLTLRADFVGQAISYRPFADALQHADLMLGPMNLQELQAVIEEPTKKQHVGIEEHLTERILKEISDKPERLPLLEFALTLLWAKQRDGKLTHAAYTKIGGVEKALADHAEEVYAALNEQEQSRTRHIFVQLIRPGEGTEDTRRLATRSDIGEENWELAVRLSSERLIVTRTDEARGEETIEVIHEALISGWHRLRDWIEEEREFRTWQERLRSSLHQWESKGKDTGALLRGALLLDASDWSEKRPEAISLPERAFIETSQQHEMTEAQYLQSLLQASEQARQEAERQRAIAEQQQQEAERQREEADIQRNNAVYLRQVALARALAAQAVLYSQYGEEPRLIERSVLLAIESLRRYPSPEADQSLRKGDSILRHGIRRLVHEDRVRAVAFSPDGQLLATASDDQTAGVWEVNSGKQVACLGHEDKVLAVAFSPGGRLLATASEDGTAGIWEASSGKQVARLGHEDIVRAVAFSPDGHLLATASDDETARVWEVSSGRQVASFLHESAVNAVAFSPDGHLLATASDDETARVWEVSSGGQITRLIHEDWVTMVVFSPDGQLLATSSSDGMVGVWEVSSGIQLLRLMHEDWVRAVAFSPDRQLLATASNDWTARVWEVSSGKAVASLAHENIVNAVAFNLDGQLLATASDDKTARVWEVSSRKAVASLAHESIVNTVIFSPDGQLLATASDDQTAGVWKVSNIQQSPELLHDGEVRAIAFNPDGSLIATASDDIDRTVGVWDVSNGRQVVRLIDPLIFHDNVNAVAFCPDGRLLATAGRETIARVWEVNSSKQVARLEHEGWVNAVAFSPDGRLLATASDDQTVKVWEVSSSKQVTRLVHRRAVRAVAFSPDGQFLATASDDKIAAVWEVSSKMELLRLMHEGAVRAVAFSPDGHLLATASDDETAGVWVVSSEMQRFRLMHEDVVLAVTFSPDGRLLATASTDKTARIWELETGQQLVRLTHNDRVNAVAFCPDGKFLATASGSMVQLWLWQAGDLITAVKPKLTRNLTPEEWKQFLGDEPYRPTFEDLP